MDYSKELLLVAATGMVAQGLITIQMPEKTLVGAALLLIGSLLFVARGFYKKYFNE